ncbi:hypothetical protein C8P63_1222 [Melghirimyces profundicolus]|uniref:DUF456 family protein n=1 Tax=Melghirimyces profundicolus TaxID=1242148 RepID=A0A2T6BG49_9BACL|nr:DUF456 family protein [Melghirimyces profundicolus]PTX55043.1 hypothetical protein C8P63_1222 [Melghirimyces profundicolus]
MELIWWILTVGLFILGFAGLVLPVLPDAPLLLLGFLVYHFLINPEVLNPPFWIGAVLITIGVVLIDYFAGGIAARTYGGSKWSVLAAVAGALAGIPFGPLGILVGPLVAVVGVEWIRKKDWREALRIGYGTLVGFLGGLLVKGLLMTGLVIWFVWLAV